MVGCRDSCNSGGINATTQLIVAEQAALVGADDIHQSLSHRMLAIFCNLCPCDRFTQRNGPCYLMRLGKIARWLPADQRWEFRVLRGRLSTARVWPPCSPAPASPGAPAGTALSGRGSPGSRLFLRLGDTEAPFGWDALALGGLAPFRRSASSFHPVSRTHSIGQMRK